MLGCPSETVIFKENNISQKKIINKKMPIDEKENGTLGRDSRGAAATAGSRGSGR